MAEIIELDGRTLEGGGQLLRIALCLSALTNTPIKIANIRGGRGGGGGLKPQHIACAKWLAHACGANIGGIEKGAKTLTFRPFKTSSAVSPAFSEIVDDEGRKFYHCRADIGTVGSTGLLLRAILPFLLFRQRPSDIPVLLTLQGGTNVTGSPSYEYITQVLLPTLHGIGLPLMTPKLAKRGWSQGPTSLGEWTLKIPSRSSVALPAFQWAPHDAATAKPIVHSLHAVIIAPGPCLEYFEEILRGEIGAAFAEEREAHREAGLSEFLTVEREDSGHDKRVYFILIAILADSPHPLSNKDSGPNGSLSPPADAAAILSNLSLSSTETPQRPRSYYLAADHLQQRKLLDLHKTVREIANQVPRKLASELRSGAWVDKHMRDQLVIFQALAQGRSQVWAGVENEGRLREPSLHARTAEWVTSTLLGAQFTADGRCDGIGFGRDQLKEIKQR